VNIFSPEFSDKFKPFSMSHIVTMLVIAAVWVAVPIALRRGISERADRRFRYVAAAVLVLQYLGWMLYETLTETFTIQFSLPLNLCDATNFLLAYLLITKNQKLFEVLYFWALAGTIQSFITPNITFAFPHFEFWVFYLQHGGEILAILYFVFVLKFRPNAMSMVKAYGWLLVLIAVVYGFNLLTQSNYMFLMAGTPHPSTVTRMIDLFGAPPRHMIGLSLIAALSILILYVPWLIADRIKKSMISRGLRSNGRTA
jgi:hypothetical integral membrane protein (TIGR02206 family)